MLSILESQKNNSFSSSTSDLLLWSLSTAESGNKLPSHICLNKFDWVYFLQQVHYHRVSLPVEEKLKTLECSEVPKFVFDSLSQSFSMNQRKAILLQFEMLKIAKILKDEGISALFFKGATLSQLAYGSISKRTFDDIDLWVLNHDYTKVREVLLKRGYLSLDYPTLSLEDADRFRHYAGEYTLLHPSREVCLDIHSRLLGGANLGFVKTFDDSWERAITLSLSGCEIKTLCPEDLLVYLSLNGLKDGWQSLRTICDIDRLVRSFPNLNWDLIRSSTHQSQSDRALNIGLILANKLFNTPIPFSLVDEFGDLRQVEKTVEYICTLLFKQIDEKLKRHPTSSFKIVWSASNNWSDRWRFLVNIPIRFWKLSTAINSHDLTVAKLPRYLSFLYYPIRVLRVAKSYGFSILEILLK